MKEKILHYYDKTRKNSVLCGNPGFKEATIKIKDVSCPKCKRILRNKFPENKKIVKKDKIIDTFNMDIELNPKNTILRRLLLVYKFRGLTIEESIEYIRKNIKFGKYISDYVLETSVIPHIVKNFLSQKERKFWYEFKSRKERVIRLQQSLMYLMFIENFGGERNYKEIGYLVRNKDRNTVLHACKNVKDSKKTDIQLYKTYRKLKLFIRKYYD